MSDGGHARRVMVTIMSYCCYQYSGTATALCCQRSRGLAALAVPPEVDVDERRTALPAQTDCGRVFGQLVERSQSPTSMNLRRHHGIGQPARSEVGFKRGVRLGGLPAIA